MRLRDIPGFYGLVSCSLLGLLSGCGTETAAKGLPGTVAVTGIIRMDGKPLPDATVIFVPTGTTKGVECIGTSNESGTFTLQQIRGGSGAPPGEYGVTVSRLLKKDGTPFKASLDEKPIDAGAVESIPPKYSNPGASPLIVTVPAAGGEVAVELKSK
jgi:hypothetical protein